MKKETIKYFTAKKKASNYAWLPYHLPKQLEPNSILDFLVQWSKKKKKDVHIYSHALQRVEENFDKYKEKYCPEDITIQIPYCDWVYYLDIWYDEK